MLHITLKTKQWSKCVFVNMFHNYTSFFSQLLKNQRNFQYFLLLQSGQTEHCWWRRRALVFLLKTCVSTVFVHRQQHVPAGHCGYSSALKRKDVRNSNLHFCHQIPQTPTFGPATCVKEVIDTDKVVFTQCAVSHRMKLALKTRDANLKARRRI